MNGLFTTLLVPLSDTFQETDFSKKADTSLLFWTGKEAQVPGFDDSCVNMSKYLDTGWRKVAALSRGTNIATKTGEVNLLILYRKGECSAWVSWVFFWRWDC